MDLNRRILLVLEMTNKIIKYTLNANGTIPDYIADGGYYGKANSGSSPQNYDLIGATVDGSNQLGIGELTSEADVKTYLDTYTSGWKDRGSPSDDTETDFDQAAAAAMLWGKKIA